MRFPCTRAILFAACLVLVACGRGGREPGLEWNGTPLPVAKRLEKPDASALRELGLGALERVPPRRMLFLKAGEWGDSLRLLDFRGEEESYAAFQELAPFSEDIAAGLAVHGDRVCFRRGRWIGVLDAWSWKGAHDRALALPGETGMIGGVPPVFGSMLQRGRVPGSERILIGEFLGFATSGSVYAVRMDCRGDTAWLYASPGLGARFAQSVSEMPGWRMLDKEGKRLRRETSEELPFQLQFQGDGVVGVEACFDQELTEYWIKMQIRGLKGLK